MLTCVKSWQGLVSGRVHRTMLGMLLIAVAVFGGTLSAQSEHRQAKEHVSSSVLPIDLPSLVVAAAGVSLRPVSAAEAMAHTSEKYVAMNVKTSFRSEHYPIDSMRTALAATSEAWLMRIRQHPITGIQIDPSGGVGVAADQEAYAKSQISARLAAQGLSFNDKAYTLRAAVFAFADMYAPERLPIAEAYIKQLDALGNGAAAWGFEAHAKLLWTYYLLGRSADVVRHGTRALELVGIMPFANRNLMFGQTEEIVYSPTIEALTGQPNARAHIERLNTMLRAATLPSTADVAFDSNYVFYGQVNAQAAEQFIAGNARLGTQAAPLIAQHWLNRPSRDSATVAVNTGKIRLIEVAHTGCAPCVYELHALERIYKRFPMVEPTLLTWTFGYWGNRLIEADEEVEKLTDYFVTNTKITFPVGIWTGKKVPNEDGGMTPEESPNLKDYPLFGKPMLWIVDGNGTIRRVYTGYSREIETQIVRTVDFLLREAQTSGPMASSSPQ